MPRTSKDLINEKAGKGSFFKANGRFSKGLVKEGYGILESFLGCCSVIFGIFCKVFLGFLVILKGLLFLGGGFPLVIWLGFGGCMVCRIFLFFLVNSKVLHCFPSFFLNWEAILGSATVISGLQAVTLG